MKTLCGIAVVVLGLWGTAAALREDLKPDGNTLLNACTAALQRIEQPQRPQTTQDAYYEGVCVGIIVGIVGLSDNLSLSPQYQDCLPPDSIPLGQAIRVVQRYLQTHPARLHLNHYVLVTEALHDAFPCSSAPSQPHW